tara:strand:+ start:2801 stop:3667 length:867 start_codon:yes stop_codon:yes gene_type:complete
MKVFVPANNKGGVGKTSTSALFAEYASKILDKNVLGIDFDPQCNFSQRYLQMDVDPSAPEGWVPPLHPDYDPLEDLDWDGRSSIANIFFGKEVVPYATYIKNFDIAPAHADLLLQAEQVKRQDITEKIHKRLKEFLSLPEVRETYDLVVIDTAPSKGALTRCALKAATHLVIPSKMEDKPVQGVYGMMQLWMAESVERDKDDELKMVGILANMVRKNASLHKQLYEAMVSHETFGKYVLPSIIGDRIAFAESDTANPAPRSILDLPSSNQAKQEALAACELIAERVFS